MNNCIVCNQPLKFIPAGVSKSTGRPYNSFWACNDKSHKQTPVYTNPAFKTPTGANLASGGVIREAQERKAEMITEFQATKDEGMRILNSKNIAGDIIVALLERGLVDKTEIESTFNQYCDYIYNYQPKPF